jgi:HSP20 family molecular chaperone IbpA
MFLLPHLLSQLTELTPTQPTPGSTKYEDNTDSYTITIELLGAQQEDLKVELNGDLLTVLFTPSPSQDPAEQTLLWSEFDITPVTLRYRLPRGLNQEELSATLAHGVLTIKIPKIEPLKREITINTSTKSAA